MISSRLAENKRGHVWSNDDITHIFLQLCEELKIEREYDENGKFSIGKMYGSGCLLPPDQIVQLPTVRVYSDLEVISEDLELLFAYRRLFSKCLEEIPVEIVS